MTKPSAQIACKRLKYILAIDADERLEKPVKDATDKKNPELFLDHIRRNPAGTYRDFIRLSSSKKHHQEKAATLLSIKSVFPTLHDAGISLPEINTLLKKQSTETLDKISTGEIPEYRSYDNDIANPKVTESQEFEQNDIEFNGIGIA
jgi:uncharacterized protein YcsI (UPF0317 family)